MTRFAPSPTGFLHIGGARTALFNWLYARGRGGRFLLRIEDTDRARHSEEAVQAILDGLAWLGLDFDGEPISQYARAARHREAAEALLEAGGAYKCFADADEIEALRAAAKAEGRPLRSPWRDRDPADAPPGAPWALRFKAPDEGETIIADAVQGQVAIANAQLDDLILLRSDGAPTYMLAVVVDDHDMGVTHVIRGDDHLTNAARQIAIYRALGWRPPAFAHIPLIHGPDGAKLSKRHGALGVEAYRDMGYLPEGLRNYLLRLGWSHGDEEIISDSDAATWFDLDGIGKAPARLDLDKLAHVNGQHLKSIDAGCLLELARPFVEARAERPLDENDLDRLARGLDGLRERAKTLVEFAEATDYLLARRPLEPKGKAAKPLARPEAPQVLQRLAAAIESSEDWTLKDLEGAIETLVEVAGGGFGRVCPPARAALTAGMPSPGLAETIYALGREETAARLREQITDS
ncbi:MAG: glutamate--tRNA ligase [Pseudomonadota bacterium]